MPTSFSTCAFLPNPHFVQRLRPFTGKDPRVARYIRSFPQTGQFLRRIESLLAYLIPHYIREGKSYLTVALGCTGGRHRSVALAEVIRAQLAEKRIRDESGPPRPGQDHLPESNVSDSIGSWITASAWLTSRRDGI